MFWVIKKHIGRCADILGGVSRERIELWCGVQANLMCFDSGYTPQPTTISDHAIDAVLFSGYR